jgi:hypothetical protein
MGLGRVFCSAVSFQNDATLVRPQLRGLRAILLPILCHLWAYDRQDARGFDARGFLVDTMFETENLKPALKVYEGQPIPALLLAHQLMAIKQCLEHGRKGIPDAMNGLDLAIDSLFPHTDFFKVSYKLYVRRLEGTIKPDQEEKLRQLGVRI